MSSATEVREELSSATVRIFSTGDLLSSKTLFTLPFEATDTLPTIRARSIR